MEGWKCKQNGVFAALKYLIDKDRSDHRTDDKKKYKFALEKEGRTNRKFFFLPFLCFTLVFFYCSSTNGRAFDNNQREAWEQNIGEVASSSIPDPALF